MEKLRIAFLAYNLGQGGAERQLFYMVKTLVSQGCYPDVYSFYGGGYWETPLRELGIRVIAINERNKIVRLWKLVRLIKQGKYRYVHSQQFGLNLYAVVSSLFSGSSCIGSIRNNLISEVHTPDLFGLGWLSLLLPARIVSNSMKGMENAKKYLRNSKSIYFLPNMVDTEVFFPGESRKPDDTFKVITVGTVWKPKRVDRVLEVAEILKATGNERKIIFEIIGDGDELDAMINLAKSKGLLNSMVFFKGRSENIASEYRDANALLLTSDFEGTPNVVLEAMSSGLPVVASNVGDVPEIIADGETGFYIECGNIKKMAQRIAALSQDAVLCSKVGRQARDYILKNHSQAMLSQKLTALYRPS